jgi:VRR-NUC domain
MSGPVRFSVTEKAFQDQVVDLAILYRWLVYHSRPAWIRDGRMVTALQGHKGFPDLIMVRPPRIIVAELKSERGQLSIAQMHWLEAFRKTTWPEVYVWRPADLDLVEQCLRS